MSMRCQACGLITNSRMSSIVPWSDESRSRRQQRARCSFRKGFGANCFVPLAHGAGGHHIDWHAKQLLEFIDQRGVIEQRRVVVEDIMRRDVRVCGGRRWDD